MLDLANKPGKPRFGAWCTFHRATVSLYSFVFNLELSHFFLNSGNCGS
jgi:hypothetical protein